MKYSVMWRGKMNKERSLEEILHFRLDRDDKVLVKWAELFEEYCVNEYGDDAEI